MASLEIIVQNILSVVIPASQVILLVFGIILLYQDLKINNDRSVIKLPYFKWVTGFTFYLFILTIYQGTTFNTFNNAFFIIHSILFFLIMQIYCDRYKWMESVVKISVFFVSILSFLSILTTVIFFITHSNLIYKFNNLVLKNFLTQVAPPSDRVIGLLQNPNVYAYILLYTFYIYIFLIVYYKNIKVKILVSGLLVINFVNLILTGSRGALVSLIISSIFFSFVLILLMKRHSYYKFKNIKYIIIASFGLIILFILFIYLNNSLVSLTIRNYISNNIFRVWNLSHGSGRTEIWSAVFSIDLRNYIFGINDNAMYNMVKNIIPDDCYVFINNCGRYHNMYIAILANYGVFAFLGFFTFLIYSIIKIIKVYIASSFRRKRFILIFFTQFVTFLISGIFEQLPLFNLSPHSLLFMFCWANLFVLCSIGNNKSLQ